MISRHPAFPSCCALMVPSVLEAIADCGDSYVTLRTMCESCQKGKNIVLDYVDASGADKHFLAEMMAFGNTTGFRPQVLLSMEARETFLREYFAKQVSAEDILLS